MFDAVDGLQQSLLCLAMSTLKAPALTNETDCRLWSLNTSTVSSLCSGRGTCNPQTGRCICERGYNVYDECNTSVLDAFEMPPKVGLLVFAYGFYLLCIVMFGVELWWQIKRWRWEKKKPGYALWICIWALIFIGLRIAGFGVLTVNVVEDRVYGQLTSQVVNNIALGVLSLIFVLCGTLWMGLIDKAINLGTKTTFYKRTKIFCLTVCCVCIGLAESVVIGTAVFVQQSNLIPLLNNISQVLATIGVGLPIIIVIVALIKARKFIHEQKQSTTPTAMVFVMKTRALIAEMCLILLVFLCTFAMLAFDGDLPVIIFFKYWGIPLSDMTIFPAFWYFVQRNAHRPGEWPFESFFSFRTKSHAQEKTPRSNVSIEKKITPVGSASKSLSNVPSTVTTTIGSSTHDHSTVTTRDPPSSFSTSDGDEVIEFSYRS
jgi:hypothetical protein